MSRLVKHALVVLHDNIIVEWDLRLRWFPDRRLTWFILFNLLRQGLLGLLWLYVSHRF